MNDHANVPGDNLTPFEYALAGVTDPDGEDAPSLSVIEHMRRLADDVDDAPITQDRLQDFLQSGGTAVRRDERRTRRRRRSAAAQGGFVDITPDELAPANDDTAVDPAVAARSEEPAEEVAFADVVGPDPDHDADPEREADVGSTLEPTAEHDVIGDTTDEDELATAGLGGLAIGAAALGMTALDGDADRSTNGVEPHEDLGDGPLAADATAPGPAPGTWLFDDIPDLEPTTPVAAGPLLSDDTFDPGPAAFVPVGDEGATLLEEAQDEPAGVPAAAALTGVLPQPERRTGATFLALAGAAAAAGVLVIGGLMWATSLDRGNTTESASQTTDQTVAPSETNAGGTDPATASTDPNADNRASGAAVPDEEPEPLTVDGEDPAAPSATTTDDGATDPGGDDPTTTEAPDTTAAPTTEAPETTAPPATETTQPPTTEPPTTQPPTTQPPETEPPTTLPPETQPPTTPAPT
ncbi:MAG: hypothetical protein AAF547_25000, partial [Actinomycetota bacterium]